jgi:hypothetical protein
VYHIVAPLALARKRMLSGHWPLFCVNANGIKFTFCATIGFCSAANTNAMDISETMPTNNNINLLTNSPGL